MNVQERIKESIDSHDVILFMKGTPHFPQCGFSGRCVQLLEACGAEFTAVDVLADQEIREGIKQYSNWPTVPQLYVGGEFVGGCDILMELHKSGELKRLVSNAEE